MADDIIEKIYREHNRRIFLYVYSICKNVHIAEDITQDTFIKAIVSLPSDCSSVSAWLYKVATNLTYDYFRKQKELTELDMLEDFEDFSVAEKIITSEKNQLLYKCIGKLERNERIVITLHYFSGFRQYEIAGITGLSYSNVRVLLLRAREKLKKYLKEELI